VHTCAAEECRQAPTIASNKPELDMGKDTMTVAVVVTVTEAQAWEFINIVNITADHF
jgi:hypothetical protein